LSGMHQGLPTLAGFTLGLWRRDRCGRAPDEQTLHGAAARDAAAKQARRKDAGIVHDEHIAGTQRRGEVGNHSMADLAAGPIEAEEAGRAPLGGRFLRNQLGRQVEVEVAYEHLEYKIKSANHRDQDIAT